MSDPIQSKWRNSHLCPSRKVREEAYDVIYDAFFVILGLLSPIGQGPRAPNFIYTYNICATLSMFGFSIIGEDHYAVEECAKRCVFGPLYSFLSFPRCHPHPTTPPPPPIVRPKLPKLPPVRIYIPQTTTFHSQGSHPHPPPPTRMYNKRPHFLSSQGFDKCFVRPSKSVKSP
jgi:hypothetical protein